MSVLRYWTGTSWEIVPTGTGGGGDGSGTQGPPGPPGQSVEVFGPQINQPNPFRKGDVWLFNGPGFRSEDPDLVVESLSEQTPPTVFYLP